MHRFLPCAPADCFLWKMVQSVLDHDGISFPTNSCCVVSSTDGSIATTTHSTSPLCSLHISGSIWIWVFVILATPVSQPAAADAASVWWPRLHDPPIAHSRQKAEEATPANVMIIREETSTATQRNAGCWWTEELPTIARNLITTSISNTKSNPH